MNPSSAARAAPIASVGPASFSESVTARSLFARGEPLSASGATADATSAAWRWPFAWWAGLAAVCAALLAPLLLVDVPPLLDYPNHLARLVVLAANGSDPILTQFYQPHWGIIPDLGIDLIGVPLLHLLPMHIAGRIVIGIVLLLPVFGTIAYSRAVLGRRSLLAFGGALVAYNAALLQGFLNFNASLGVALLLAAAWLLWREHHPVRTLALSVPGAVALFFCHLMGLLFFALLIGVHEFTELLPLARQPAGLARAALRRLAFTALVFVVPAALYAMSHLGGADGDPVYPSIAVKAWQLLYPFVNYSLPLDIATAALLFGGLVTGLVTRHIRVPRRAALTWAAVILLYLAAPFAIKGVFNLDARFIVLLGFLLWAGAMPVNFTKRARIVTGTAVAGLFAVRMLVLGMVWYDHNTDLAELRAAIAAVPPGSSVFLTSVDQTEAPDYWDRGLSARLLSNGARTDTHMAALLVIERRAWWPFLFDNPSSQPIRTRSWYRALGDRVVGTSPHRALLIPGRIDLCDFQYLLLLEAGAEPDLAGFAADRLRLRTASDFAALYDVRPNPACPAHQS